MQEARVSFDDADAGRMTCLQRCRDRVQQRGWQQRLHGLRHRERLELASVLSSITDAVDVLQVLEESSIVAEVTFGETSGGAAIVQGSYVGADQSMLGFTSARAYIR